MAAKYQIQNNPLENNPLFNKPPEQQEETTIETETEKNESKSKGRPKNPEIIHEGVQSGLTADFTRATFILSIELLNDLKNYAYTERLSIKDAVDILLSKGIEDYKKSGNTLLDRNSRKK